jgi:hypothetical protein
MKKIIRLTESDLTRIIKRVIEEQAKEYITQNDNTITITKHSSGLSGKGMTVPKGTKFTYVVADKRIITGGKPMSDYIEGEYKGRFGTVSVTLNPCKTEFKIVYSDRAFYGENKTLSDALNRNLSKCTK